MRNLNSFFLKYLRQVWVLPCATTLVFTTFLPCGGCSQGTPPPTEAALAHLQAGDRHLAAGRYDAAITEYTEAIRCDSDVLPAHLKLASVLVAGGRVAEAEERLAFVLDRDPDNVIALAAWGRLLAATGRVSQAESVLRQAAEADPPSVEAVFDLARVLAQLRRDEEALVAFARAAELSDQQSVWFLVEWAAVLERQQKFGEAQTKLEDALRVAPEDLNASSALGLLLTLEGDPERGLPLLEQAAARRPTDPALLYRLGRGYLEMDRDGEALDLIQRSVAATDTTSLDYAHRLEALRTAEERIPRASPRPDMPNILLVVIDTLRADHLGAYGYERLISPTIDRIARRGVLFETVISPAPWTAPAVASLLTGLYPSVHGLDGGIGWGKGASAAGGSLPFAVQKTLPSGQETLPELLRRAGYQTAGFVSNLYVNSIFGFAQGFDYFDDDHRDYARDVSEVKRRADATNARVFEWLETQVEEPWFLFVHFNDPHWPYNPPPPYGQEFVADYRGPLTPAETRNLIVESRGKDLQVSSEDLGFVVGLYDGEIQYVDAQLALLLDAIAKLELARDMVTVVTSDHGEEFLDHGGFSHGFTLYEEQLRVPLILSAPARLAPSRVSQQVRLIDLAPTLLELARVDGPTVPLQGSSLLPYAIGDQIAATAAFAEATYIGEQSMVRTAEGLKMIQSTIDPQWLLFDLGSDPSEERSLAKANATSLSALMGRLDDWRKANLALREQLGLSEAGIHQVVINDRIRDGLRALGYVQ
jgi:arylsulfatase A-like enzyme/Flp pilus assembly protein TadD